MGRDVILRLLDMQTKDAFTLSDLPMRVDVVDWFDLDDELRAAIAADMERIG